MKGFLDPQALALMMGGANLLAASRGGNRDLTKGGLGYGLQQGLLGAAQGYQMGTQFKDKDIKDQQRDRILGLISDRKENAPESVNGMPAVGPTLPAGLLSDASPAEREFAKAAVAAGDYSVISDYVSRRNQTNKPTSLMQNAEAMGLVPGSPEYEAFLREAIMKPNTTINNNTGFKPPAGFMIDPSDPSRVIKIPGTTFSQAESEAAGFATRMSGAENTISGINALGYDASNFRDQVGGKVPLGNYAVSPLGKLYRQAQEDWVRSKLRKESGAVIGADEMEDEIKTYFPQLGDSPSVMEQKRKARLTAQSNLVNQSQGAFDPTKVPNNPVGNEVVDDMTGKTYIVIDGKFYEKKQ